MLDIGDVAHVSKEHPNASYRNCVVDIVDIRGSEYKVQFRLFRNNNTTEFDWIHERYLTPFIETVVAR